MSVKLVFPNSYFEILLALLWVALLGRILHNITDLKTVTRINIGQSQSLYI